MSILTPLKPPYMNYHETTSNPLLDGDGAEIPVFIGKSNNTGNPKQLKIYKNYNTVKVDTSKGGLGVETTTTETDNPLLFAVKQFFEEASQNTTTSNPLGVSKVYVIDLGANPTVQNLKDALEEVKKVREIQVIGLVGFEKDLSSLDTEAKKTEAITDQVSALRLVYNNLLDETEEGRFKIAYFRLPKNATITESIAYTSTPSDAEKSINEVRIVPVRYTNFGKIIAQICTTPYYIEPGYPSFKSVSLGEFELLTPTEKQTLFDAGVVFGEDDYRLETPVPRICAGTSSAFGKAVDERPNDSLLHARRNADHQMRKLLKIIAPQLKRNETATNILYMQADCEAYLSKEKDKGRIMDFNISVEESDSNPYNLLVTCDITPVNSTYAIDISCYINSPYTTVTETNI